MTVKISVLIDENLENSLRLYQAEQIKKTGKSVSFSGIINWVLQEGLKNISSISTKRDNSQ